LPGQFYDVIIVGAGPAGSYTAYRLASSGYSVAVLEQKEAVGVGVCCTGIVSAECFDSFGVNPELILNRANSAKFFSPSGKYLRLQDNRVQVCVLDRASFDQAVARKAQAVGVDYLFLSRATDIVIERDKALVEISHHSSREKLTARAVILANGFNPRLSQKLNLGEVKRFAIGAQIEVEAGDVDEVEIYFNQRIAPGFFAWLVPTSASRVLVGLLSMSHAKLCLQKFLLSPYCQSRIVRKEDKIKQKAIPLGTLPRSYGNRILVVGDAAGQVKPTTGGGIYFGHLGAKIAAEVLGEALSDGDLSIARLSCYQRQWKAKMGEEISLGYWTRRAYSKLSDRQVERIFNMFDSGGIARTLLDSPNLSFDWHSRLILASLRHVLVYPLRKAWHLFHKEVGL